MHDLYLANQILKTALAHAKKHKMRKVNSIKIELGDIVEHGERILPENLILNFQLLAKETIAKDAKLEIIQKKGNFWRLLEIEGK